MYWKLLVALTLVAAVGFGSDGHHGADPVGLGERHLGAQQASVDPYWGSLSELTDDGFVTVAESGRITAGDCTYAQAIEDVHVSSGDASVHGFWKRFTAGCPSKSRVKAALQAVYCTQYGCGWKTVVENVGDIYAGGGSGKRVTARNTCSSSKKIGWRGRVDVDLIGQGDPAGYTYSSGVDLYCYPSR